MTKNRPRNRISGLVLVISLIATGCGDDAASETTLPWTEEDVTFIFDSDEIFGVLTLPPGDGPFPAVVLIDGSASEVTGVRQGTASRAFINFSRAMVRDGYAVLRYDPPGVGRSTGEYPVEILDDRVAESMAALRHVQSRPDVVPENVGLWGGSQGSWVIAQAAADHPEDVAFIISVSGAGISVADQQVWGIETQSAAAGLADDDVARAGLMGRLLVDWQLTEPIYRAETEPLLADLGPGPWEAFAEIVYQSGDSSSAPAIEEVIELLEQVQDEPWAAALFLKELYLPRLRAATPELIAELRASVGASLLTDPRDSLTRVRCPVLAIFGENDIVQPTERSATLFEEYLTAADTDDVIIVVMPGIGHDINWTTPGYNEAVSEFLGRLA
ncbi:MAG: alpha/beta hydrolase [Acidimicrobiia bacterium]|nr:alpha/beta hydrolase [Acidimicrobiia bacterium]NNJ46386.1 alpha/beta hydrolase [Acidimicrobiia bacterium]